MEVIICPETSVTASQYCVTSSDSEDFKPVQLVEYDHKTNIL